MHLFVCVYLVCMSERMRRSEETTLHRETGKTGKNISAGEWSVYRAHQAQLTSVFSHLGKKKGKG